MEEAMNEKTQAEGPRAVDFFGGFSLGATRAGVMGADVVRGLREACL
jgi:hypothetical protein